MSEDYKAKYELGLAETDKLRENFGRALATQAIRGEMIRRGCIDVDLAIKLIDFSGITSDIESEVVLGVSEAVDKICAVRPILFPGKQIPKYEPLPLPRMYQQRKI